MNKIGLLSFVVKKSEETDDYVKIRGMASTDDIDRMGDVMEPDCWTKGGLVNYMNNPIVLFNHDYDRPIGKCSDVKIVENGLEVEAHISKADPAVASLVKDGILSTFSVGFRVKDADYMKETGGLLIKEAELFEISVVSVPANQAATFEVVKMFSPDEFKSFKQGLKVPATGKSVEVSTQVEKTTEGKFEMDEKELKELIAKQTSAAVKMALAEKETADKKAAEEAAAKAAANEAVTKTAVEAGKSGAEALLEEVKKAFDEKAQTTAEEIEQLKKDLIENKEQVSAFQNSKRQFFANNEKDWKKAHEKDITDAYILGVVTEKGWDTNFANDIKEKVNEMSSIEAPAAASTAVFEHIASTSIERDIQNALMLAPLFREIAMNSATMTLPILPDAGYAEFTTAAGGASYTGGKGNLRARGDALTGPANGIDLGQKVLTTHKLMSVTFLANDTEEDMILPILPLLQESMVRSHARSVEHAILLGGHSTAVNTGGFDGLIEIGKDNSTNVQSTTAFNSDALTAANLLTMRKALGKYGVRPQEVVYIVSERAYFELLEDPEYQDANLVGQNTATKLTGEIGRVFNSPVILVDEFNTPAVSQFHAVAVNPRNFVVPRLRGTTLETDYRPRLQHRELIATQRLGFSEIITGATAVVGRNYSASAT
jgi:HK97 family phage prohead protease